MLAIQVSLPAFDNPMPVRPACPNCGRSMHLSRTAPVASGRSELRTYRCGECAVSLTETAEASAA